MKLNPTSFSTRWNVTLFVAVVVLELEPE